jgi:hypothetical protein
MRESALVIYRDELISVSRGNPASVEFNFEEVWDHRRKIKQKLDPRYLHWVHVHPIGFSTRPSAVDEICAASLKAAFGAVERFGILCFADTSFKNIRGLISWYRWDKRFTLTSEHELEHDPLLNEDEVFMLKALSYGELWQPHKSESTVLEPSAQTSLSS